jgi:dihydroorotate dehydrogenase
MSFASPVGVAAGFDRFGRIGRRFGHLGFGFAELGTVSLSGGPDRPSLAQAVLAARRPGPARLGIVVGPDEAGTLTQAMDGVAQCLEVLASSADYLSLSLCGKGGSLRWPLPQSLALLRRAAQVVRAGPLLLKIPAGPHLGDLADAARAACFDGIVIEGADAALIAELHSLIPVVAVGGIHRRGDVRDRMDAGACLVQCCRPLMRYGPLAAVPFWRQ